IALAARDVASDTRFILVTTQVALRIERLLERTGSALRRAAAKQIGEQLDHDVGQRAGAGQQDQYPYPDRVAAGLDAMDDQQRGDDDGEEDGQHGGESLLQDSGSAKATT